MVAGALAAWPAAPCLSVLWRGWDRLTVAGEHTESTLHAHVTPCYIYIMSAPDHASLKAEAPGTEGRI